MPRSSISTQNTPEKLLGSLPIQQVDEHGGSAQEKRSAAVIPKNQERPATKAKSAGRRRSNEEWLVELRGLSGVAAQQVAHQDLTSYLYVVVLNHLQWKYAKSTAFADIHERDIATFVGDFVQDFMVKLMKDEYALLTKYSGRGQFTSWAAQVAHNLVGGEMRRAYWRRETETAPDELPQMISGEADCPESIAIRNSVGDLLYRCLEKLPTHYRTIIERCILMGESATDIANEENVTPNSIYIRLHRAKESLRKVASAEGIGSNA